MKRNLIFIIAFMLVSVASLADDDFGYTKKPDTSSSDTWFPVESFGGTFDVSSLGAATYTVPIDVPIGVKGMQPNLSITYNSQSSFGLLGLGFNLSGLSSITRGPKTVWQDGVSSGMTFDSDCALYLDGERLISEKDGEYSLASNRLVRVLKIKSQREVNNRNDADYIEKISEIKNGKVVTTERFFKNVYYWEVISADETVSTYECLLPYTRNDKLCEYSWVLTSVVDKFGNKMTVDYLVDKQNWFVYPKTFTYGKNTVTFKYEGLSEESHRFSFADKIGCVDRRISSIVSKTGDDVYCSYELSYYYGYTGSFGARTSLLSDIRKKNGDGESIKPISYNWGSEPIDFSINSEIVQNIDLYKFDKFVRLIGNRKFLSADINGDGISDIIEVDAVGKKENNRENYYTYLIVYASYYKNDGSIGYRRKFDPYVMSPSFDVEHKAAGYYERMLSSYSVSFADFNNDGIQDLFIPFYAANKYGSNLYGCFLYGAREMNDMSFAIRDYIDLEHAAEFKGTNLGDMAANLFIFPVPKKYDLPQSPLYAAFDIDNDGIGNYLILESVKTTDYGYRCYIGTPNDHGTFDKNVCFLNLPKDPKNLYVSDYNKDGMIDIMAVYDDGYSVFYNQGKEKLYFAQNASVKGKELKYHDRMREGDFDGDGFADYFYFDKENWYVAYGNGNGQFENRLIHKPSRKLEEISDCENIKDDDDKFTILVYDADHDGMSDIFVSKVQYKENHVDNYYWATNPVLHTFLLRSKGGRGEDGFCSDYYYKQKKEFTEENPAFWMVGDFNGEGRNGLLHFCANENVWFDQVPTSAGSFVSHKFKVGKDYRKLKEIVDAMDNTIEINYEPLTNEDVYSAGKYEDFPLVGIMTPVEVVSSVKRSNGVLPSNMVEYHYKGLKYHSQGRGVLGFEEITSENKVQKKNEEFVPKSKVVNRIESYDSQFYTPTKVTTDTYAWIIGEDEYKLYNSACTEYAADAVGDNGNYFHHPEKKTVTDLYGNKSYVDYRYDVDNYVLTNEVAYSNDENASDYTLAMAKYMKYEYPSQKNYKGMLKPEVIYSEQKHKDDKEGHLIMTKLEYDSNGLLVKQIDNYKTDKERTTETEYDCYGNVIKTTVSGSDIKTKVVHSVYDDSNRFLALTFTDYAETPNTATLHKYDKWGHCTYTATFDDFVLDDFEYDNSTEEDVEGARGFVRNEYDSWGNLVRSVDTFGNIKTVSKGWGDSQDKKYYILTQGTHTPWVKTWYDSMGREVETESVGAKDIALSTKTKYDENGNVVMRESNVGKRKVTENIKYDEYNRVVKTESSTGEVTTTDYDNRSVTVSNGKKTVTKEFDSWGNPTSVDDGECEITYKYNSNGQPSEINSDGDVTKFEYDDVGNKISMKTSDRGTTTYKYNVLGECVYTKDNYIVHQNTQYDEQGRVIEKKSGSYVTKYSYGIDGSSANKLTTKLLVESSGKLCSISTYGYDEYGRVIYETKMGKNMNGFRTEYEYNSFGEVQKVSHWISEKNVTVATDYVYDCYGNKREVFCNDYMSDRKSVWKLQKNTGNYVSSLLLGCNGLESEASFDNAGRLENSVVSWRGSAISSLKYSYDPATGNMVTRTGMLNKTERFYYDDSDRLTEYRSLDSRPQAVDYSGNGNIIYKSDLGTYKYQYYAKPNRLTQLDNEYGACPLDTREISYNVWNRVSKIKDVESGYEMQFSYDEDGNRNWAKLTKNGTLVREIEYAGNIEHVKSKDKDEYFVYLGDNLLYHYNEHVHECLYLCTDHLGSIMNIVDEQGNTLFDAKYDAWGNQEVVENCIGFIRGYTGHEEIPELGLVNMNARLYDPLLGRFLSADDYVQMPENSQNFNRYAYCMNNPLKYSDPSGNFIEWAVVAIAAWQAGMTSWANGDSFMGGAAQGAAVSIVSQGFAYGIGSAFGHQVGSVWNEALRAGAHGLSQGALSAAQGGDFWTGFAAGSISSIAGSAVSAKWDDSSTTIAITTLTGGLATLITDDSGNSFFQGAMIGFNVGCLNHCGGDNKPTQKDPEAEFWDWLGIPSNGAEACQRWLVYGNDGNYYSKTRVIKPCAKNVKSLNGARISNPRIANHPHHQNRGPKVVDAPIKMKALGKTCSALGYISTAVDCYNDGNIIASKNGGWFSKDLYTSREFWKFTCAKAIEVGFEYGLGAVGTCVGGFAGSYVCPGPGTFVGGMVVGAEFSGWGKTIGTTVGTSVSNYLFR